MDYHVSHVKTHYFLVAFFVGIVIAPVVPLCIVIHREVVKSSYFLQPFESESFLRIFAIFMPRLLSTGRLYEFGKMSKQVDIFQKYRIWLSTILSRKHHGFLKKHHLLKPTRVLVTSLQPSITQILEVNPSYTIMTASLVSILDIVILINTSVDTQKNISLVILIHELAHQSREVVFSVKMFFTIENTIDTLYVDDLGRGWRICVEFVFGGFGLSFSAAIL